VVVVLLAFVVLMVLQVDQDLTQRKPSLLTATTSLLDPVVIPSVLAATAIALAVVTLTVITAAAQKDVLHSLLL
jgi:hypothetical protein